MTKMYPTCTGEFVECHQRHYGIELSIEDLTPQLRNQLYDLIKFTIEQNLSTKDVSWVYLAKTEGHLQNCTTASHSFGQDPHGNRDEGDGKTHSQIMDLRKK